MKIFKFIRLVIYIIVAAAFLTAITVAQSSTCFKGGENYTFFVGDTSKNCREVVAGGNAALKRLTLKNICGECTTYKNFDVDGYIKAVNGEIIFTEQLSDSLNLYLKADLPYSIDICGRRINLHICIREDGTKVASPIIFGGY